QHAPTSTLFPYTTLFRSNAGVINRTDRRLAAAARTLHANFALLHAGFHGLLSGFVGGLLRSERSALARTPKSARARRRLRHQISDRKSTRLNSSHVSISY